MTFFKCREIYLLIYFILIYNYLSVLTLTKDLKDSKDFKKSLYQIPKKANKKHIL